MSNRISAEDLQRFCIEALSKAGLPPKEAETVADVLVMTDTWGTFSHGTGALSNYLISLHAGGMDPNGKAELISEGDSWAVVDGGSGMGMPACCLAMNTAIEKARTHTITWAGVRNSNHFGAAGYYANMAASEDMIGIAMSNADPNMVAPGGKGSLIGNNPLAYAVPAGEEYPILLDIALSAVAAGKILTMKSLGQPIPPNWLTDAEGLPVAEVGDWPASGSMVPMAGHKGYGIALLIETLAALLPGAKALDDAKSWIGNPAAHGGLGQAFIVINPASIVPIEEFKRRVDEMIRKVHDSPKAANSARIYLPGEMEWERREDALVNGIDLPASVLASLHSAARYVGMDPHLLEPRHLQDPITTSRKERQTK
jgi:LDH2 family malate/lactate/ureidoglycolate dehydrogenase